MQEESKALRRIERLGLSALPDFVAVYYELQWKGEFSCTMCHKRKTTSEDSNHLILNLEPNTAGRTM